VLNLTCPSCGAAMDLRVALEYQELRELLVLLLQRAGGARELGGLVLDYLSLFKPTQQKLRATRTRALLEPLLHGIDKQQLNHRGRLWQAPEALWLEGFATVLAQRDLQRLTLPLKDHSYLYTVMVDRANKAESSKERAAEADRLSASRSRGVGQIAQLGASFTDVHDRLRHAAQLDESLNALSAGLFGLAPAAPKKPSLAAREMHKLIAARAEKSGG
jgi:hypothetical protein